MSAWIRSCRKIVAVGRNYAKHAKELNNAVPSKPILFLKPPSSIIEAPEPIEIPDDIGELHHEVELGVIIGKPGRSIDEASAMQHVSGYVLALDMTARGVQSEAKKKGLPWSEAKGQDTWCPVSELLPASALPDVSDVTLWLSVDGEERQRGNTRDMLFPVPRLISYISNLMKLEEGDLILTGTPEGVGPVRAGSVIDAGIDGVCAVSFTAEERARARL